MGCVVFFAASVRGLLEGRRWARLVQCSQSMNYELFDRMKWFVFLASTRMRRQSNGKTAIRTGYPGKWVTLRVVRVPIKTE